MFKDIIKCFTLQTITQKQITRKQRGAVVRARYTWPENSNYREVLVDYALFPSKNDNSAESCANIRLWCGCYLHTTKTTKHALESTFPRFSFNFTDGQVGENPSTPLERAPLKLGTKFENDLLKNSKDISPQSREILQMFVKWGHKLPPQPPPSIQTSLKFCNFAKLHLQSLLNLVSLLIRRRSFQQCR